MRNILEVSAEVVPSSYCGDNVIDGCIGNAKDCTLANLVPLAKCDDIVECGSERGGVVSKSQENCRRSGYERRGSAAQVELESTVGLWKWIIILGQNVKDDDLFRLPLLIPGKNRKHLIFCGIEPYRKAIIGGKCLRCPISHGNLKDVVDLARDGLLRLNQNLLERRVQAVKHLG